MLNIVKKILISFVVLVTGWFSKVLANGTLEMIKINSSQSNGVKYGVIPTLEEKVSTIGKITIPIILFLIGICVLVSKRITVKAKLIMLLILLAFGIMFFIFLEKLANKL